MSTREQSISAFEENIRTFEARVAAFAREDPAALSDAALTDRIGQLVAMSEVLETCVTRLANTVIARTFAGSEVVQTG